MPTDVLGNLVDLGLRSGTAQQSAHQMPGRAHHRCSQRPDLQGSEAAKQPQGQLYAFPLWQAVHQRQAEMSCRRHFLPNSPEA